MARILIPIDGSETSLRAVRWLIGQIRAGATHELFLLNVQPEIPTRPTNSWPKPSVC